MSGLHEPVERVTAGPIVVLKFGGTSVADPERIRAVAARVAGALETGRTVCVVVSGIDTTTDELIALAREVSPRPHPRELDMLLSTGERISMALLAMAIHDLGRDAVSFTAPRRASSPTPGTGRRGSSSCGLRPAVASSGDLARMLSALGREDDMPKLLALPVPLASGRAAAQARARERRPGR